MPIPAIKAFRTVLLSFASSALAHDAYVYVQGEVRTPGGIKYTSEMTLRQAIAIAGGLTQTGFTPLCSPDPRRGKQEVRSERHSWVSRD
jgi:hypothetical protein